MPNNAKKSVYKEKEFQMYILWKSLPAFFRGMKKDELRTYGFTDPVILKVTTLKTQTAFAKYFHIKDLGTLTDWNAKIKKNNLTSPILDSLIQKETSSVREKISSPENFLLEKKIYKQRKLISQLKKENGAFKKRAAARKQRRRDGGTSLSKQNSQKKEKNQSIFEKAKNIFLGWKKKSV